MHVRNRNSFCFHIKGVCTANYLDVGSLLVEGTP
jgi:hypothetical protein